MKRKQRILSFGPCNDLEKLTQEIEKVVGVNPITAFSHESHEARGDSHMETYYTAVVVFKEYLKD